MAETGLKFTSSVDVEVLVLGGLATQLQNLLLSVWAETVKGRSEKKTPISGARSFISVCCSDIQMIESESGANAKTCLGLINLSTLWLRLYHLMKFMTMAWFHQPKHALKTEIHVTDLPICLI